MVEIKSYTKLRRAKGKITKGIYDELKKVADAVNGEDSGNISTSLATSYASGPGYTQNQLGIAFGLPEFLPETFVGVYINENDGKKYLITIDEGEFKGILFNAIS